MVYLVNDAKKILHEYLHFLNIHHIIIHVTIKPPCQITNTPNPTWSTILSKTITDLCLNVLAHKYSISSRCNTHLSRCLSWRRPIHMVFYARIICIITWINKLKFSIFPDARNGRSFQLKISYDSLWVNKKDAYFIQATDSTMDDLFNNELIDMHVYYSVDCNWAHNSKKSCIDISLIQERTTIIDYLNEKKSYTVL